MMNCLVSAAVAPSPSIVRAAVFAVLAMGAIGAAQLWQHSAAHDQPGPAAGLIDATQPLAPAPSSIDMWRV
jgi:hypothetical protein